MLTSYAFLFGKLAFPGERKKLYSSYIHPIDRDAIAINPYTSDSCVVKRVPELRLAQTVFHHSVPQSIFFWRTLLVFFEGRGKILAGGKTALVSDLGDGPVWFVDQQMFRHFEALKHQIPDRGKVGQLLAVVRKSGDTHTGGLRHSLYGPVF